jgi:hypothetical protein
VCLWRLIDWFWDAKKGVITERASLVEPQDWRLRLSARSGE